MQTVNELVAEIRRIVDVDDPRAVVLLNRSYRGMVGRARSYRKTISVGPSVANQRDYALPTVTPLVELWEVLVDGVTYGKALHIDIASHAQGWLILSGEGGVIAPEEDASGAAEIALIPTPTEAGLTIEVRAAWLPPELATGGAAATILIDHDLQGKLVLGAVVDELRIVGEGDPDTLEDAFERAVQDWTRRTRRKFRGSGPSQIRVVGYTA